MLTLGYRVYDLMVGPEEIVMITTVHGYKFDITTCGRSVASRELERAEQALEAALRAVTIPRAGLLWAQARHRGYNDHDFELGQLEARVHGRCTRGWHDPNGLELTIDAVDPD